MEHAPIRAPLVRTLVLALVISLPTATSAWHVGGQREPNTREDAEDGWMWTSHDAALEPGASTVYFNAFETVEGSTNPNAGIVGSRVQPSPSMRWAAVLGIWRDCNGDRHIGLAQTAAATYPSALVGNHSRCPASPGSADAHNDGTLVRELIAIGAVDPCRLADEPTRAQACPHLEPYGFPPGILLDADARIWSDAGRPGDAGSEACALWPMPRGTTANTGLTLRYLDCASEHRLIGLVNTIDDDGRLGLAIDDPHHPERSRSLLVHDLPAHPYASPTTGRHGMLQAHGAQPTATAWSCSSEPAASVALPGGTAVHAREPYVRTAPDPTQASVWEAAAQASDAAAGDCDPTTTSPMQAAYPTLEAANEPGDHAGRDQNDVVLRFHERQPQPPTRLALEPWRAATPAGPGSAMGPTILPEVGGAPLWIAEGTVLSAPQTVSRGRLTPVPATYWTFYARLGAETLAAGHTTPAFGGDAVYGAEACGSSTTGVHNGWVCDASRWWRDGLGDTRPRFSQGEPLGAEPGWRYHLRDVDCHDGRVVEGMPLFASLTWLHPGGPCPPLEE